MLALPARSNVLRLLPPLVISAEEIGSAWKPSPACCPTRAGDGRRQLTGKALSTC